MKNSLNCDFNMINMIHVIKRKYGEKMNQMNQSESPAYRKNNILQSNRILLQQRIIFL